MAEEANQQAVVLPPSAEIVSARSDVIEPEVKDPTGASCTSNGVETREPTKDVATGVAPIENSNDVTEKQPATIHKNVDMKDETTIDDAAPAADESAGPAVDTLTSPSKSKARRKSGAIPEHKNKKLNKKASKAKMTHTDAKPGEYFFVRLKGYPLWPAIVCDETMLPNTLIKSRPVTALRPDGSYRADYEDGGPKVKDRTFPVMYLHTNEFGWIPNYDLVDLDFETVGDFPQGGRKDLYAAHQLAAERHDLNYFKDILKNFMEARQAEKEAKEAAKAAKKASKSKRKSKTNVDGEVDDDVEMPDRVAEADSEEADAAGIEKKKSKKRKADEDTSTPQRSDSVKKPRPTVILTNTPKTTNGTATPKSGKAQSAAKSTKSKPKKPAAKTAAKAKDMPEADVTKEPESTPEDKRVKKEKEILFLRHKLQKGLLTRDQEPKEEEMKHMSEFVSKLEGYADLEVSIIRATKINKVLKAILKLSTIPKEEEFQFKPRSQTLLDKWNKLLASEQGTPVGPVTTTNGINDDSKIEGDEAKGSPETTNGVKESLVVAAEEKVSAVKASVPKSREIPEVGNTPTLPSEEDAKDSISAQNAVESTA